MRGFRVALAPVFAFLACAQSPPGQALFYGKGQCSRCHSIENRGGSLGPDLSEIGLRRNSKSLRLALTDPSAEVARQYLTVIATTTAGQTIEGLCLNEDDVSIQLRDTDGNLRSFSKDGLRGIRREERSLMPSYASKLSRSEIDDLVAWLETLRGRVAPDGPRLRTPGPLTGDVAWLNRANRDSQERPETLLDALEIPDGATVVDLGAGTGYFTWRLARRVGPRGKVIAVDLQENMLDAVKRDTRRRGISNVEIIAGEAKDPHLPERAVDLVFIANSYHEFSQPEAMMAAVRRCLKPDGRVVVIEYASEIEEDPTTGIYTMSFKELRSEIERDGFRLQRLLDFLPLQHGLIFAAADSH